MWFKTPTFHSVGSGFAAYRIYGTALLMNDNGIDGTIHSSTWAQIGNNSPLQYGFVTFVNCNIEDFGTNGIDVIQGFFRLENSQILGNQPGTTVNAIRYETNFTIGVSEMDAQSDIFPTGNFANGIAIHSATTCPPLLVYNVHTETSVCYAEGLSTSYNTLQFTGASAAFGVTSLNVNEFSSPDEYIPTHAGWRISAGDHSTFRQQRRCGGWIRHGRTGDHWRSANEYLWNGDVGIYPGMARHCE